MNTYSQLLRYLKQISAPLVNTVTQGDFMEIDLSKVNIYPLTHIMIGNARFVAGAVIEYDVQIGCFDIRDVNKEVVNDKFERNDNEIDNLNSTLAVLNRIWLTMYKDFDEQDITASEVPVLNIAKDSRQDLLDGWIMDFQVQVPNKLISLCSETP